MYKIQKEKGEKKKHKALFYIFTIDYWFSCPRETLAYSYLVPFSFFNFILNESVELGERKARVLQTTLKSFKSGGRWND